MEDRARSLHRVLVAMSAQDNVLLLWVDSKSCLKWCTIDADRNGDNIKTSRRSRSGADCHSTQAHELA